MLMPCACVVITIPILLFMSFNQSLAFGCTFWMKHIHDVWTFWKLCMYASVIELQYIRVITKLPNSEQSYKGKIKTHNYIVLGKFSFSLFRASINHGIAISTSLETFEILNLMFSDSIISLMSADFKFSFFKTSKPQYKKSGRWTNWPQFTKIRKPLPECCLLRAILCLRP